MAQLNKGTTYSTGDQVTAANLNALVDNAILQPGAINDQIAASSLTTSDSTLLTQLGGIRKATLGQLQSVFTPAEGIYLKSNGSVPLTTGQQLTLGTTAQIAPLNAVSLGHLQNNYLNKDGSVSMTTGQLNLSTTNQIASLNAVSLGYLQSNYKPSPVVAWVKFNGFRNTSGVVSSANTNRQIKASYNVSSVTRNSTGVYKINFELPLVDANYNIHASATYGNETGAKANMTVHIDVDQNVTYIPPTINYCSIAMIASVVGGGNDWADAQDVYVTIIR
jgi:hypothetical protein